MSILLYFRDSREVAPERVRSRLAGAPPSGGGRLRVATEMPDDDRPGYDGMEFRLTEADLDTLTNGSAKVRKETRARLQANGILRPDPSYDGSTFGLAYEPQDVLQFPGVERGGTKKRGGPRTPERSKLGKLSAEVRSLRGELAAQREETRKLTRQLMETENSRPLPLADDARPGVFEVKRREEAARRAAATEAPLSLDDPLPPLAEELPVAAPVPVRAAPRRAVPADPAPEEGSVPERRPVPASVLAPVVPIPTALVAAAPAVNRNSERPVSASNLITWLAQHDNLRQQEVAQKDKVNPTVTQNMEILYNQFSKPVWMTRKQAKTFLQQVENMRFEMRDRPGFQRGAIQESRVAALDKLIARLRPAAKKYTAVGIFGLPTRV
jgi:hypothetical protein